jgi:hypothetical protein
VLILADYLFLRLHAVTSRYRVTMGEMLTETKPKRAKGAIGKAGPGRGKKNVVTSRDHVLSDDTPPTLADLGVSKRESAQAYSLTAYDGLGDTTGSRVEC